MKFLLKILKRNSVQTYQTPNNSLRTFAAVGYPKVGNTWLRISLGRYLQNSYNLPELPLMDSAEFLQLASAGCKAIGEFTHYPLEWTTQKAEDLSFENVVLPFHDQRVLLLVRHPLDTLVSQYMHYRYMLKKDSVPESIVDFIDHPVYGLDKLIRFYTLWAMHHEDTSALHIWRYEDAKTSAFDCLSKLLIFLGEEIKEKWLEEAINFSSFNSLSAMERDNDQNIVFKSSGLSVFGQKKDRNPNSLHVRKGIVGGYKDEIPSKEALRFETRIHREMPALYGYC